MFSYRTPKSSIWGAAIRYKDPVKAKEKVNAFFAAYFEPLNPEWESRRQMDVWLSWNVSRLPNVNWPEEFLKPENQKWQRVFFMITDDRICFPRGLLFPLSSTEAGTYEFLGRFAVEAPFRMNAKYFMLDVPSKKKNIMAWRKPDATIKARLEEVIA